MLSICDKIKLLDQIIEIEKSIQDINPDLSQARNWKESKFWAGFTNTFSGQQTFERCLNRAIKISNKNNKENKEATQCKE